MLLRDYVTTHVRTCMVIHYSTPSGSLYNVRPSRGVTLDHGVVPPSDPISFLFLCEPRAMFLLPHFSFSLQVSLMTGTLVQRSLGKFIE